MTFISVDLPEPDGPMIATYSLRRIARSTPRRARTISPPMSYSRLMPRVTITQSLPGAWPGRADDGLPLGGGAERGFERCLLAHDVLAHVLACGFFASTFASRTSAPSFSSRIA